MEHLKPYINNAPDIAIAAEQTLSSPLGDTTSTLGEVFGPKLVFLSNSTITTTFPELSIYTMDNQVIDKQKGRLIARIIAATRKEKRDAFFNSDERNKDLSILSKRGKNMGRPLTTFMARLKEDAIYPKPLVESLIARMVK